MSNAFNSIKIRSVRRKITKCQLKVANISRYDIENMQTHFPNLMISFDVDSTLCRKDTSLYLEF